MILERQSAPDLWTDKRRFSKLGFHAMSPDDAFHPFSDSEVKEMLLDDLTKSMSELDPITITEVRDRFLSASPESPERLEILEVVDGHLALRELARSEVQLD